MVTNEGRIREVRLVMSQVLFAVVDPPEWSADPMKPPTPPAISAMITPEAARIQGLAHRGWGGIPCVVPPVAGRP
jgi:hypothetical protein